ncbi:ABC transporter permease [Galbitalea sp. SE-J8]|uniref:ABC transporter permease n=1 Tax=Galbitalea sp. SE-J8 TaxID=3054952 RepID=UPI00259CEA8A|nr:ABC transporter permease [Galbitalea sp. SE-J8]MDM4764236.1 ABC transporter permease [Galbitalea sp. SE-J8]
MTTALSPTAPALLRRPSRLTTNLTFISRSLTHTIRTPDALVMAIMLPVILMLLFTLVFGGAIQGDGHYVDYVVPGIILLCAGYGASSVAVDVANDMTNGIIDRFRTMPLRASSVITGHVVASLVRNLVATGVVIGVAFAVGFRPDASPLEWVAALGLVAVYILVITYLFAAVGIASGGPEAAQGYGFILMFLPYVSSAFVGVDTMPAWLRPVAEHQPLTPIIETIRGLLTGGDVAVDGGQALLALGWIALILAVAIVWTALAFRARAGRR